MNDPPVNPNAESAKSGRPPVVRLVNVHKRFDNQEVLRGVDVDLVEGETTVIIGESGAGKSVILNHIIRLLRPDHGEVYYRDWRMDILSERQLAEIRPQFGFLFQLGALFDSMTVGENVGFPVYEHTRKNRREIAEIVKRKLTMVGLDGIQHKWPAELSGGERKRVALARAIALDPRVILYDEPTTGLDPPRADVINELIIKLQRELGVTSVVVTHDMASAGKVADRILMLHDGKFIFDGTPQEITQSTDVRVRCFVEGRCREEDLASLRTEG